MTNSVYQATIEELEAVLSPRVVSRSLQEGLRTLGKTPQTVSSSDLEMILKSQVYRQLQVAMPVTEAKIRIGEILAKLQHVEQELARKTETGKVLEQQGSSLHFLKDRLKPFNLYFEWPEVQKLRALVQLLDAEHAAGHGAEKLVNDAREQLNIVEQKLEDQLVKQAQDISDLESTLEQVRSLGGPKVKRFENLLNQIQEAQKSRQLAPAEVERVRKLALDLRKLMESSIVVEAASDAQVASRSGQGSVPANPRQVSQESIQAKLLELDLANETRELGSMQEQYSLLLSYQPDLLERFSSLQNKLTERQSIAALLAQLSEDLAAAQTSQRDSLYQELQNIQTEIADFAIDTTELSQGLQIGLGILETFLAPLKDVEHLRRLFRLAKEQNQSFLANHQAEKEAFARNFAAQQELLSNLHLSLEKYQNHPAVIQEVTALQGWLVLLNEAQEAGLIQNETSKEAQIALARLEKAAMEQKQSQQEREKAQLRHLMAELRRLVFTQALQSSAEALRQKLEQALSQQESLGEASVRALAEQLAKLNQELYQDYKSSLLKLRQQAETIADQILIAQIEEAQQQLPDVLPDLDALVQALKYAKEQRQKEQISDLHNLETELSNYAQAPKELLQPLQAFIHQAQDSLAEGTIVADFDEAWLLLDRLRQDAERRISSFIPRLDRALLDFNEVMKLNTEEASQAGRILKHLHTQRETFAKTSPAMQQKLESSLAQAESFIGLLKEQLEATRAIAGQLVSGNILDSLFGPSSTSQEGFSLLSEPSTKPKGIEKSSSNESLNSWIADCKLEPGISTVLVFESGSLLAGYSDLDIAELSDALLQLESGFNKLGKELSLGHKQLSVVEMLMHSVISAWATKEHQLIVIIKQPTLLNSLLHKLRQDLTQLNLWLQSAAHT